MPLSNDLISQFVKITKDKTKDTRETIVYGTVQDSKAPNGLNYVKIDGSDLLTPVLATTVVSPQDRVTIMIKNHSAVVTGNLTSPAARSADTIDVYALAAQIARIDNLETIDADVQGRLTANIADINDLKASTATISGNLTAAEADIDNLQADTATINSKLTAAEADIVDLKANTLTASQIAATYATIENLNVEKGRIDALESTSISAEVVSATYATIESLNAEKGRIDTLETTKLSAADIEGLYANIDFSNISKATMGQFYANSGLIQNVVVGDSTITGKLVGVTISGDLIEGNTVKAEKLVIKGTDGLYYKLNTDGVTTEAEQTNQNSLDGSVIKAKSVTASKVNVTDLVAFGATIGGFTITDSDLYSGVKSSATNTTRGIYLGKDAQAAIGDGTSYIKYYKDSNGAYKLDISADSITLTSGGDVETQMNQLSDSVEANSTKANAAKTAADAAQADVDALETRMTSAETTITQNSEQIALRATKTEVSTAKDAAISAAATDATNKADALKPSIAEAKKAGTDAQSDVDALTTRVNAAETSITQNADAIALRATKTEVNAIKTTADAAATQLSTKGLNKAVVDLLDTTTYSTDMYYPVVGTTIPYTGYHTFEINNQLEANSAPTWSTHASKGFTCNVSVRMIASGWGTTKTDIRGWIDLFSYNFCDKMPAYITQMGKSSFPVFYLRGGGKYYIYSDYKCTWNVKTETYTNSSESVAPTASPENDSQLVNNWTNNTRLKTAETSIKQNSDAIALCATKNELSALDTRVTSAESSITILANSIASNVTETTNLGTRTTTIEQTADGLTARMTTAESNITTAQSTADTAKTNAAKAQTTADTAKTNAATAQSTADTAKTNAATAQTTADAAKKTATNFISVDTTNGVLIGNKTSGSWSGTRAQITNSAFNILDTDGTILSSYGSTTTIGKTAANNIYIDGDGVKVRKNGKVLATFDQYGLKIANANDSSGSLGSGTTKPALVIGTPTAYHIEMDNNEIMAKSNATTSSHLFLNMEGGNVSVNNNANRAFMFQEGALYAKNSSFNSGEYLGIIDALNDSGNTTFGYGGYLKKIGGTNIYGNSISLVSNGNIDVEASWINCRSIAPNDHATYALGVYGEKGWSNIYLGKGDGKTNALHIISGSSTYTLCGVNSSGQYIFGNNAAVMYYQVKNVSETATGNAFKVTSGNNTAANNTSSIWFFGAADATSRYIGSYLTYNRTYSSAANMVVTANGIFGRSTSSSERYKKDIQLADINELKGLYDLPVKRFKYKEDYIASDDELYDKDLYGFIVEDLENVLPCAVQHKKDTDGTVKPEMWNSNIIIPSLLKLIQDLNNRLKTLEEKENTNG